MYKNQSQKWNKWFNQLIPCKKNKYFKVLINMQKFMNNNNSKFQNPAKEKK
jgi:hypothetical protein